MERHTRPPSAHKQPRGSPCPSSTAVTARRRISGWRPGLAGWLRKALQHLPPLCGALNLLTSARFVVRGDSMLPTLASGQYLLVSRVAYLVGSPQWGDVVVLQDPGQPGVESIKRIVGLPGEQVSLQGGHVFIDGCPLKEPYAKERSLADSPCWEWFLGEEEYFVMGDHRADSRDSRAFGPVPRRLIVGKAWLRYWPRDARGRLRS